MRLLNNKRLPRPWKSPEIILGIRRNVSLIRNEDVYIYVIYSYDCSSVVVVESKSRFLELLRKETFSNS